MSDNRTYYKHSGYPDVPMPSTSSEGPMKERERDIPNRMRDLTKLADRLDEQVGELQNRLTPITRPPLHPPPSVNQTVPGSCSPPCELSDALQSRISDLSGVCLRLADLLDRLEI